MYLNVDHIESIMRYCGHMCHMTQSMTDRKAFTRWQIWKRRFEAARRLYLVCKD